MKDMTVCIAMRQNLVARYIATQPILELFLETTAWLGGRVAKWWWEQEGVGLAESWAAEEEGRRVGADDGVVDGP